MNDPIIIPLNYKKYIDTQIYIYTYIHIYIYTYRYSNTDYEVDKLRSAPNHFVNIIGSLYQLL